MILLYIKLPKNTIYLNDLLFLTYGVNKEIKKYILRRQYNTINERLFKTNLLKCCWSQKAELKFSFKYNYNHELVKWWKQDPLSAAHDVCLDPLVPAPGFRLELVVWTFRLVSSWAWAFCLVFFVPGPFFSSKKNVHWVIDLEWKGMKAYKIGSSCCSHKPKTTTTLVIFTLASILYLFLRRRIQLVDYLPHPGSYFTSST